jgi:hypothetical protein
MPFFAKVLLFFSVPALMFAVLAVPSLKRSEPQADADAWHPLASAGLRCAGPQAWRRIDPLGASTPLPADRWMMGWPGRERVSAAAFVAPLDAAQITVFVGPSDELLALVEDCEDYYKNSVMIERDPTLHLQSTGGLDFQVERARYLPGPLVGEDSTRLLAWATRGEQTILVNGGGPTAKLSKNEIHTFLRGIALFSGR